MREIIGKIVDETFFGLCCIIFTASALWIFPEGSFFRGCSICLALIFGIVFYLVTIVRVSRKKVCKRYTKAFWLSVVVGLPVIGGLLYYYLRLAVGPAQ